MDKEQYPNYRPPLGDPGGQQQGWEYIPALLGKALVKQCFQDEFREAFPAALPHRQKASGMTAAGGDGNWRGGALRR